MASCRRWRRYSLVCALAETAKICLARQQPLLAVRHKTSERSGKSQALPRGLHSHITLDFDICFTHFFHFDSIYFILSHITHWLAPSLV
jgi:hypothetical protein